MRHYSDDLSKLSPEELINLWPPAIKGELTKRADKARLSRAQYLACELSNGKVVSKPPRGLKRDQPGYWAKRKPGRIDFRIAFVVGDRTSPFSVAYVDKNLRARWNYRRGSATASLSCMDGRGEVEKAGKGKYRWTPYGREWYRERGHFEKSP